MSISLAKTFLEISSSTSADDFLRSIGKRMDRKKSSAEVDEEISKKVFAREMDIDEDLLK